MITFLDLQPVTRDAAYLLMEKCPWVIFTSGRRSWLGQAHAMAVNVVKQRNWLGLVYKRQPELQAWVDAHPLVVTVSALTDGLVGVLQSLPEATRVRFAHPAGLAFDIAEPAIATRPATVDVIQHLPGLKRFLEGEGGLPIWHAQFIERRVV